MEELGQQREGSVEHGRAQGDAVGEAEEGHQCREAVPEEEGEESGGPEGGLRRWNKVRTVAG